MERILKVKLFLDSTSSEIPQVKVGSPSLISTFGIQSKTKLFPGAIPSPNAILAGGVKTGCGSCLLCLVTRGHRQLKRIAIAVRFFISNSPSNPTAGLTEVLCGPGDLETT
ncbi:hypothetical protein CDAR_449051 [Caerostris darwini]|uniref:Uncharacterized protein n=1 Tax=Caerostris darwini TaxID=1538125 RepID=A0AAV4QW47_9ARAC|nr:hypothetical protein CDAR_449051 [Caerostris darwini]